MVERPAWRILLTIIAITAVGALSACEQPTAQAQGAPTDGAIENHSERDRFETITPPMRDFFELPETTCPTCADEGGEFPSPRPGLSEDVNAPSNDGTDGADNSSLEPGVDSSTDGGESNTTGDARPDGSDDERLDRDDGESEEVEEDDWRPPSRGSGADDPPDFIDPSGSELV